MDESRVQQPDRRIMVGSGQAATTTDGGDTWAARKPGIDVQLYGVSRVDDHAWEVGDNGVIGTTVT